jgi:hypothetical protein
MSLTSTFINFPVPTDWWFKDKILFKRSLMFNWKCLWQRCAMINVHCLVAVDTVKMLVMCRKVRRDNECSRDVQVLSEWCYSADGKSGSQVFILMAWKGCKASITIRCLQGSSIYRFSMFFNTL